MGGLSIWHWLIVLAVVVLIFGTKKLRSLGSDLGGAVKGFKEAMHDETSPKNVPDKPAHPKAERVGKTSARTKTSKKPATKSKQRDV